MTYATLLITLLLGTLLSAATMLWSIFALDVEKYGVIAVTIFLIALLLTICGATSLIAITIRRLRSRDTLHFEVVKLSVRQGFLAGALVCSALILQKLQLFSWITFVLLFLFFVGLELYAASTDAN